MDGSSVVAKALTLLPDETLPEFDETLATRLEAAGRPTIWVDAPLIGRYATAAILPRVKAVYEKDAGNWTCDIEDVYKRQACVCPCQRFACRLTTTYA